ncbi:hypothetical protein Nepgr_021965 [Nepenthes gracilis]|uniref:Ubiquitin thioesterase OTU n=1 Tax=Nepenthes gracilis TaxID=150966 RepID=A0AAD3SZM1_NEPGR|nr:hypothetical protein Nepgr_021965 [Nepenthes gracilis]
MASIESSILDTGLNVVGSQHLFQLLPCSEGHSIGLISQDSTVGRTYHSKHCDIYGKAAFFTSTGYVKMMIGCPTGIRAKSMLHLGDRFQKQMRSHPSSIVSQSSSSSCCLVFNRGNSARRHSHISISNSSSYSPVWGFQAFQQSCSGFNLSKQRGNYLRIRSSVSSKGFQKMCIDGSFGCQNTNVKFSVLKCGALPSFNCNAGRASWSQGCASAGLMLGSLFCCSSSNLIYAEAPQQKEDKEEHQDPSSVCFSHGKKVYRDYSVIGIPGDGRCLFRSVAHGACLRSGKPAPSENLQRELADELRAKVADEFIKRREETEWFIEGDFDTYISQIRKPHVWGGEPELLMLSHVLEMPITVYMHDENSRGLISIAEYGQEYGEENPIRILYYGFGHYDTILIPGKKGGRSAL